MDNSRPFVPAFIRKFDRKLLLKNPSVWSARTHLVLYFSILFTTLLALLCVLFYADARQDSSVWALTGFVVVIVIIGFIFWLIYLLRFNVFKRFGNWEPWDGLRTFLLYFINVLVIVAIPFVPSAIETFMANSQFSDAELVNDVNELNINANVLEYDRLPKDWKADTFHIFKSTYEVIKPGDTIISSTIPAVVEYKQHNINITDRELESRINNADSSLKVNDSLYIMFTVPDYLYVNVYNMEGVKNANLFDKKEIYYAVQKNYGAANKTKLNTRMEELKKKYASTKSNFYANDDYSQPNDENAYKVFIQKKYSLSKIKYCIQDVAEKKFRWKNSYTFYLHFIFYTTLIFSLLVFIFRHSTKKTFFLSVLTAVVLAIITSLIIVMLGGSETSFFILMILYFVTFAVMGFSVSAAKTRTVFQGIGLNFFLFALPVIPLLLTSFYFERIANQNIYDGIYTYRVQYYFYAEIIGFILLLVLIEPVFKKLYTLWYSSPEE